MKKIMLLVVLAMMQTQWSAAQVDYTMLNNDHIWLFDYPYSKDLTADGFVFCKDMSICEYEDAHYPQMLILESIKEYRRDKAVINPCSFYFGGIRIDQDRNVATFTRSEHEWHIIALNDDAFVLKKGKKVIFDYEASNELPKFLKFKRNKKYTKGCLPILLLGGGSMDSDIIEAGFCNYFDVLSINSPVCVDYWSSEVKVSFSN